MYRKIQQKSNRCREMIIIDEIKMNKIEDIAMK